jgi:hypothetical protein
VNRYREVEARDIGASAVKAAFILLMSQIGISPDFRLQKNPMIQFLELNLSSQAS